MRPYVRRRTESGGRCRQTARRMVTSSVPGVIDVTDDLTSVAFAADEAPQADAAGYGSGKRVTVTFARTVPVPADRRVRVRYDTGHNGEHREFDGTPQFTHTTTRADACASYHYRMSHWEPVR